MNQGMHIHMYAHRGEIIVLSMCVTRVFKSNTTLLLFHFDRSMAYPLCVPTIVKRITLKVHMTVGPRRG